MKKNPFRLHHLFNLLDLYDEQALPLDYFLSRYFRENKSLGSKDRAYVAETVYALVRNRGLIDAIIKRKFTWEKRLEVYENVDLKDPKHFSKYPDHICCSFPKALFELIEKDYGREKAIEICQASNERAPTYIRVNPLKTTREKLFDLWKDEYPIALCKKSDLGIIFHKKINFWVLDEFKKGWFEVQDEASQLVSNMVQATPQDKVLDFCAGSGGKTLAFAPRLERKGQIFLHDIRSHILKEAKKRLKRAGIENSQLIEYQSDKLKKLKKKMDWVLVDAPCTGTGTLRRNPDMKWKFDAEMLKRLTGEQRTIFEQALSYLKPGGKIVYATCSILKEENQEQVEHFKKTYNLSLVGDVFQSFPEKNEMDGFFAATFTRNLD